MILELFRKLINKEENSNLTPIEFELNGEIKFELKIKDLVIGQLSVNEGYWIFKYSKEFIEQDKYARLTGFSDLNKEYKADLLWPFFKVRIPGLKQPMIRDIIKAENLDVKNEAVLLKRFGLKTMANPYILESI